MSEIIILQYLISVVLLIMSLCVARLIIRKILTLSRITFILLAIGLSFIFFARLAGNHFYDLLCFFGIKYSNCDDFISDWDIRNGIDDAGLIIIGLFLACIFLIYKNPSFKEILKNIKDVNFLSLTIPLEEKIEELERDVVDSEIDKLATDIFVNVLEKSQTSDELLELLSIEIEKKLKEIYTSNLNERTEIPFSIFDLILELQVNNLLEEKLADAISNYFNLKRINSVKKRGKNTLGLIELGRRILHLLLSFFKKLFFRERKIYGKTEEIRIGKLKAKETSIENVVVYSTVSIRDSLFNYYPLENLTKKNFKIKEEVKGEEKEADIIKIESLSDGFTELFIVLAIDCSGSMEEDEKLIKSKETAIYLINSLKKYPLINCKVSIYKISTESRGFVGALWTPLSEANSLIDKIESLSAHGWTPLWQSLIDALNVMSENTSEESYKLILCLTDGIDNIEDTTNEALYEHLIKKVNIGSAPPIYSIGFGKEDYSKMIKLSNISGAGLLGEGAFVRAQPEDLTSIFTRIIKTITKSYRIYWTSTSQVPNTEVRAIIEVSYSSNDGKEKKDSQIFEYILKD